MFFITITLLFLDFTGTIHTWFGWMAKIQLIPAVLALNVGVVLGLVVLTLLFGRVYCSVICPLGVMQDIFAWLGKRKKKNRYTYSPAKTWLRYIMLGAFIASLVAGTYIAVGFLAPYSAFGRIASNLFAPIYQWCNNGLAYIAERMGSYAFYETEIWVRSLLTFGIALITLLVLAVLAWRNGRTYCNTICPVGTVLGALSRFSWLKPVIDTSKCVDCGLCGKKCKAACIDTNTHTIDYSRCVACMDCLESCSKKAISYCHPLPKTPNIPPVDSSRRAFLATSAMMAVTTTIKAQEHKMDGGLAVIEDKAPVDRKTPIVPPGAMTARNFLQHCTACQLCVSVCPNGVLRPSIGLSRLMQPEMDYDRGYCRPECTKCSEVCPAGAIRPITREDKSSTQIGHAVWVRKNCIPLTDGETCGNCRRHCPTGAIQMIDADTLPDLTESEKKAIEKTHGKRPRKKRVPVINVERCIGCGACEALCPARPFTAIYVEGHERHRTI